MTCTHWLIYDPLPFQSVSSRLCLKKMDEKWLLFFCLQRPDINLTHLCKNASFSFFVSAHGFG